ncbi:MAG: tetratricopeptide repeat protein [Elusimicrobia bacterium]|nr:tetratricopeptide repeat protein [Elusimicrobiota bacterium]
MLKKNVIRIKRIFLVFSGLLASALFLEAGLRIGGYICLSRQESGNRKSLARPGVCRILCLGESTTAGQWPRPLEGILNEQNIGVEFSVIDKGRAGTYSSSIMREAEGYIKRYNPDIVVVMMGINDGSFLSGAENGGAWSGVSGWIKTLRVYRMADLLKQHAAAAANGRVGSKPCPEERRIRKKECAAPELEKYIDLGSGYMAGGEYGKAEKAFRAAVRACPGDSEAYVRLALCRKKQGKYCEAEKILIKAADTLHGAAWAYVELGRIYRELREYDKAKNILERGLAAEPENEWLYIELGNCHNEEREYDRAEKMYAEAIRINGKNVQGYIRMGMSYCDQKKYGAAEKAYGMSISVDPEDYEAYAALGKLYSEKLEEYDKALGIYEKALAIDPENTRAYIGLGSCFKSSGDNIRAEEMFKKAVGADPGNYDALFNLGWFYGRSQKKYKEAEEMLKKAIAADPARDIAYLRLGWLHMDRKKYAEARDVFRKALKTKPANDRIYRGLAQCYEMLGKKRLAGRYYREADRHSERFYNPETHYNYKKLKDIILQGNAKLVCVQYPMRDVQHLKKIFDKGDDIVFVDNEGIFKDAVRREGYDEYFIDSFAGDFGHCTEKGNRLLARNIGRAIAAGIFGVKTE